MGELIGKVLPTLANLADHTYVECGTRRRAWGCWGRKAGGQILVRGTGSTRRGDKIAQSNERAGVTCYLINGVCHQAANRILLPAGVTVRGARGYGISQAIYGVYGRVLVWPCRGRFKRYKSETRDLPECVQPPKKRRSRPRRVVSDTDRLNWSYVRSVVALYDQVDEIGETFGALEAGGFEMKLFMHMAEFQLGPALDQTLGAKLRRVRARVERRRAPLERARFASAIGDREFVDRINQVTLKFQDEMANSLKAEQYESLFEIERDERVILADPEVVQREFDLD